MKIRRAIFLILFFAGLTVFTLSLLPFFRDFNAMFWVATIVGGVLALIGAVGVIYRRAPKTEKVKLNSEYERKSSLVTRPELEFLRALRQINPDKYEVIPQVALVNVIDKKTNTSYRNELFRVCDYCFVDKTTFEPLLLVELNDSSHKRADRAYRDEKVAAICDDAGLPLVTFWMADELTPTQVKRAVKKAILK